MPTLHEFFIATNASIPKTNPAETKTKPIYFIIKKFEKSNSKIQVVLSIVNLNKIKAYITVDTKTDRVNFADLPLIDCFVDKKVLIFRTKNARMKNISISPKYIFSNIIIIFCNYLAAPKHIILFFDSWV
jgi:hypothetical protein